MIEIKNESSCCGCAACAAKCPQKCISMKKAALGTLIAQADKNRCISCGICDSVCPMRKEINTKNNILETYAAYSNKKDVRHGGSSGGIFGTFATALLEQGYIVYGAAFDEGLNLKCTSAAAQEELKPLLKSKYLQSDLSDKYSEIEKYLKSGRKILFVSTPCQVFALKLYLKKEYDNLTTVDFLCHGVPSQEFFSGCIEFREKREDMKIIKYIFRAKKEGGSTAHYHTVEYIKNGKRKLRTQYYFDDPAYAAFQQYINLRESCYDCKFAVKDRVSDVTISDFHDVDRYIKGINRFDGVSTVFISTQKGKNLWDTCKNSLTVFPLELNRLIDDKVCFAGGTKRPEGRDRFIELYPDFDKLFEAFLNPGRYRIQRIYYSLPKAARKIIKRIKGV